MTTTVPRTRAPIPLPTGAGFGIALGLAAVSYGHILSFAEGAGARLWEAIIIAATVDGLIVMALAVIGHARRHGVKPPKVAKAALLTGVVATGGANLHHGLGHGWEGVAMAVWVPLVAELSYLLAMAALRIGQDDGGQQQDRRPAICGGHLVAVATVMARVDAGRRAAEEQEAAAKKGASTGQDDRGQEQPAPPRPPAKLPRPRPVRQLADVAKRDRDAITFLADRAMAGHAQTSGEQLAAHLATLGHAAASGRTCRRIIRDLADRVAAEVDARVASGQHPAEGGHRDLAMATTP